MIKTHCEQLFRIILCNIKTVYRRAIIIYNNRYFVTLSTKISRNSQLRLPSAIAVD